MSRISSTTLFNFTNSFDYLEDNLTNGIYCNNTFEKLPIRNIGYSVPMACFCDIPLSLIKEHFKWYGKYGIGINRSYARKIELMPVWYVTSENPLVKSLIEKKELDIFDKEYLLPYLKQFIGNQKYNDGIDKRKKFYDEREWRYIPNSKLVEHNFGQSFKSVNNSIHPPLRMKLDLSQIEYIIIENINEFDKIIKVLKKLTATTNVSFETLISKLITSRHIERDF
ncbi:abortive infection system antitoxin AbiGi family protein [Aquirufa nivalisilvae]